MDWSPLSQMLKAQSSVASCWFHFLAGNAMERFILALKTELQCMQRILGGSGKHSWCECMRKIFLFNLQKALCFRSMQTLFYWGYCGQSCGVCVYVHMRGSSALNDQRGKLDQALCDFDLVTYSQADLVHRVVVRINWGKGTLYASLSSHALCHTAVGLSTQPPAHCPIQSNLFDLVFFIALFQFIKNIISLGFFILSPFVLCRKGRLKM